MESYLTTDRLLMRPRGLQDLDACLAMDRDPLVTQYIEGPWGDPGKHRAFLLDKMATTYPHPLGYWSITFLKSPDVFLGWIMVLPMDSSQSQIEIGWRLRRDTWGKGVATEATRSVLSHVKALQPDSNIMAAIHPANYGSIKVAEKIGMVFAREEVVEGGIEQIYVLK